MSRPGVGLSLPLPCAAGVRAGYEQSELAPEQLDTRAKIRRASPLPAFEARGAEDCYTH